MPKTANLLLSGLLFYLSCLEFASAASNIDCSPLDPRVKVSQGTEGKVQASATTLYKIAKTEGSMEGKVSSVSENLQSDVPISERVNAQNRLLYVFCEMIAKDNLPQDKKYDLYVMLLNKFIPLGPEPKKCKHSCNRALARIYR